jgi:hypothetical protein
VRLFWRTSALSSAGDDGARAPWKREPQHSRFVMGVAICGDMLRAAFMVAASIFFSLALSSSTR